MTTRDLGAIYTRAWYEGDFAELGPEFALAAAGLARWAKLQAGGVWGTVLDVGCGPGMLVEFLNKLGFDARGFDGSPHAIAYAQARGLRCASTGQIHCADVLMEKDEGKRDLVICTEVAEHVPAPDAARLVGYLVAHADGAIVFTAAPPGQGGHDHVNEQPRDYWLDLFAKEGWIEDEESTAELKRRWSRLGRLSHMARNVIVLH